MEMSNGMYTESSDLGLFNSLKEISEVKVFTFSKCIPMASSMFLSLILSILFSAFTALVMSLKTCFVKNLTVSVSILVVVNTLQRGQLLMQVLLS